MDANKKNNLADLTVEEIKQSYEFQKRNNDWTFYQEREFIENLLQTRFNFLITVYTLFLLTFFQVKDKDSKIIILLLGLIIVGIMGLVVYRVYVKFNITMDILYNLDEHQVFLIVRRVIKKRKFRLFNVNRFIGYIIPIFLFLSIVIMGILLIVFDFKFQ